MTAANPVFSAMAVVHGHIIIFIPADIVPFKIAAGATVAVVYDVIGFHCHHLSLILVVIRLKYNSRIKNIL